MLGRENNQVATCVLQGVCQLGTRSVPRAVSQWWPQSKPCLIRGQWWSTDRGSLPRASKLGSRVRLFGSAPGRGPWRTVRNQTGSRVIRGRGRTEGKGVGSHSSLQFANLIVYLFLILTSEQPIRDEDRAPVTPSNLADKKRKQGMESSPLHFRLCTLTGIW